MATRRSLERRKRIRAIRRQALKVIAVRGRRQHVKNSPGEDRAAKLRSFEVSLTSPVPGLEPTKQEMEVYAERGTLPAMYAYHLNIWTPKGKVMFLTWVEPSGEDFEVVSFRRGDWEEAFLALKMETDRAVHH